MEPRNHCLGGDETMASIFRNGASATIVDVSFLHMPYTKCPEEVVYTNCRVFLVISLRNSPELLDRNSGYTVLDQSYNAPLYLHQLLRWGRDFDFNYRWVLLVSPYLLIGTTWKCSRSFWTNFQQSMCLRHSADLTLDSSLRFNFLHLR